MTHPSSRCHRLINGRNVDLWNQSKSFASSDPVHFEQGGLIFKWPPGTIELKPILDYWWMCGFPSNVDSYIRHIQHIVLSITCTQYIYVYYRLPVHNILCVSPITCTQYIYLSYRFPVHNILCVLSITCTQYIYVYNRLPVHSILCCVLPITCTQHIVCLIDYLYAIYCVVYYRLPVQAVPQKVLDYCIL